VLHATLPPGTVGFVDGGAEKTLWGRVYRSTPDVERRAAAELGALATAAAAAAAPGSAVTIVGEGMLARLVHAALLNIEGSGPAVVIDTSGIPGQIQAAVEQLPRCGLLVLAAPPKTEEVGLATYADIHRRGLSIMGIPWPCMPSGVDDDPRAEEILRQAIPAVPSTPVRRSSLYILRPRERGCDA
jgi:threonine dehydrogenase-like Zn-dependent dehydrogenase